MDILAQQGYHNAGSQLNQAGERRRHGHSHGSQLWCAEQSKDPNGVEQNIQRKRQHVQHRTYDHPVDAAERRQIDFDYAPAEIADAHIAEIGCADSNQLPVVGEQQHHPLRHQQRRQSEAQRNRNGEAQRNTFHHLNGPHVALSVILCAEDGDSGTQAVEDHEQHAGILRGQGYRRNGGLSHVVKHNHVGGADGGTQQILDDDGQDQLENLAVKCVPAQTPCFFHTSLSALFVL